MSNSNKDIHSAIKWKHGQSPEWIRSMREPIPLGEVSRVMTNLLKIPECQVCAEHPPNLVTNGEWFRLLSFTNQISTPVCNREMFEKAQLEMAYHGSCVRNLRTVMRKGLEPGPSETMHRSGVYCEGSRRITSCFCYMTHEKIVGTNPYVMWAVLFELAVNKNPQYRKIVHGQWCQDPKSVWLLNAYVHAIPFGKTLDKGFRGWYNISQDTIAQLLEKSPEEL